MPKGILGKLQRELEKAERKLQIDEFESFSLYINASYHLFLYGCSDILHYTEDMIILKNQDDMVKITGTGLQVSEFTGGSIKIQGNIMGITLKG